MSKNELAEYHLEVMNLQEFGNSLIQSGQITREQCKKIYDCLKKILIKAEFKPFLLKETNSGTNTSAYYKNYVSAERRYNSSHIPDVYSFKGDFYILARPYNISSEIFESTDFPILFNLKLLEIESTGLQISEFLNFQLYDNFLGDKVQFGTFLLYSCIKNNDISITTEIITAIQLWIQINIPDADVELIYKLNDFEEEAVDADGVLDDAKINSTKKLEDFKIEGHFSDEEISKFFSFLYEEISCKEKPFLEKEDVEDIFKNGFVIPANLPKKRHKLNYNLTSPKKIIDYAIHFFYINHSKSLQDKNDFLRFFGNYITDYADAIKSKEKLKALGSNISGNRSPRSRIEWRKYLPERFHNKYY